MPPSLSSSDILLLKQAFIEFCDKVSPLISDTAFKSKWVQLKEMLQNDNTKPVDIIVFVQEMPSQTQFRSNPVEKPNLNEKRYQSRQPTELKVITEPDEHRRLASYPTAPVIPPPEEERRRPLNHEIRQQQQQVRLQTTTTTGVSSRNLSFEEGSSPMKRVANQEIKNSSNTTNKLDVIYQRSNIMRPRPFQVVQSTILAEVKDAASKFHRNTNTLICVESKSFQIVSPKADVALPPTKYVKKNFNEYAKLAEAQLQKKPLTLKDCSIYARTDQDFKTKTREIEQQVQTRTLVQRKVFT